MKEFFRKSRYILFILIILIVNLFVPEIEEVEAKTLRDLKAELAQKQQEYEDSVNKKHFTEEEIENKRNTITQIRLELDNIQNEIKTLNQEIEDLNIEIKEKEKEIKQIMNYYQLSSSESAYLEYIFEAADFTDFIYRMAIAEQLSKYNDKLVAEYHAKIKENEQKTKELDSKTISLNDKQVQLEAEIKTLGNQLDELYEESLSIEEEIDILKESINLYENVYKCNLDDNINSCAGNILPPGTAFYRPLVYGRISSNYGYRTYTSHGKTYSDFHEGIDMSRSGHGASIYSVAAGKVVAVTDAKSSYARDGKLVCGGNKIFIAHTVNGKKYTSAYYHVGNIYVSVGDIVTSDTVIATVGGDINIEYWEKPACTSASHLHFQIATGHYTIDYGAYSGFKSRSFNPRDVLNFPSLYGYFYNRTTKY